MRLSTSLPVSWFCVGVLLACVGFVMMATASEGSEVAPVIGWILIGLGLTGAQVGVIAKGVEVGMTEAREASKRGPTP